jgi:uncharacterized protein YciI
MLFAIYAIDRTDAPGLRPATRPDHLVFIESLGKRIVLAGPLLTPDGSAPIGSLVILEAADLAAAQAVAAEDPYSKVDLFSSVTITPFRAVYQNVTETPS